VAGAAGGQGQVIGSNATNASAVTAAAKRRIPDISDPWKHGGVPPSIVRVRRALAPAAAHGRRHRRTVRSRSAFEITESELRLIAAAATIGESSQPSQG